MNVEVVDIRKIVGEGKTRALADLKFGGCLLAKGFAVVEGANGVFVSMPRRPSRDGRSWSDILLPVDEGLKQEIETKVMEAYDRETDGA